MSFFKLCQLKAAGLFKDVWLFSGHQALKGYDELTNFHQKNMILTYQYLNKFYIRFHGGDNDLSPKIAKFGQAGKLILTNFSNWGYATIFHK